MEVILPWQPECLLNAFYVFTHFLLARPQIELHFTALRTEGTDLDIRLHDYSLRYQLHLTCVVQVIRTVFAAQHLAHHYSTWARTRPAAPLEVFAKQTMTSNFDIHEVARMVRDGQRLLQFEQAFGTPYICFIVAFDWSRFEATSDALLYSLTQDLSAKPVAQAVIHSLAPDWTHSSFMWYHGQ